MSSPDFIEVYDNALDAGFCRSFIERFEASQHKVPGRTGGGVDTTKKISTDLYLNQRPEFKDELSHVLKVTTGFAEQYFRKYHFALIAPMALTLTDPASGKPVAVTQDNYAKVAEPQAGDLMKALYRLGGVQAQKYDKGSGNYNYWHCEVFPEAPANEPLHRDEIVKRVLKSRFVKETTILLNLQGKPQFKRVAKATYALAE